MNAISKLKLRSKEF